MKNRLIVAAIGIPALLAVIFFTPIWGWGIVVAIMASFCAWELLHTAMPKFVPRFACMRVCGAASCSARRSASPSSCSRSRPMCCL
ncbi:MAG: hypothetical protein ACLTG4_10855 [Oscillospiraceae bacterium]